MSDAENGKKKKVILDFVYSLIGIVVMNGVLQVVVYPGLECRMGSTAFGDALVMMSVIAIIAITFGSAANYSYMSMIGQKCNAANEDFQLFLGISCMLSLPVCLLTGVYFGMRTLSSFVLFALLTFVTIFRYYSEVAFRKALDYKRFCLFYVVLSLGYVMGLLFYEPTHSWMICILVGEIASVLYVLLKGGIFVRPTFSFSDYGMEVLRACFLLAGTYLINALILHGDRVILKYISGGDAVTIIYVASLGGKIIALVSVPLDGVIIGYLTKYEFEMGKKSFFKIWVLIILAGFIICPFCYLFSHVFVRLFYPDVFLRAKPIFMIANAGQVFYFLATTLSVILLRYLNSKYQLYVNLAYLVLFCGLAIPFSYMWSSFGMAAALLIANLVKAVFILGIGLLKLPEGTNNSGE